MLSPLPFRIRFLTKIPTNTLIEGVTSEVFHTRGTKLMLALMLAELAYRMRVRDGSIEYSIWYTVFGERVPMAPGFGAASAMYLYDRDWARVH